MFINKLEIDKRKEGIMIKLLNWIFEMVKSSYRVLWVDTSTIAGTTCTNGILIYPKKGEKNVSTQ